MTVLVATTCDRCNPDGLIHTRNGRGYILRSPSEAVALGWATEPGSDIDGTDDTHYCVQCLEEEDAHA